jgi:hypothetical protein
VSTRLLELHRKHPEISKADVYNLRRFLVGESFGEQLYQSLFCNIDEG